MKKVLKKNIDLRLLVFPVAAVFILLNIATNDAFTLVAPYIVIGISILYGLRIYKELKSPAADINHGVLTIYDQGSSQSIEKENIEHLKYIEKTNSLHEIQVKLKGYQPWIIELRNKNQHLKGNRLFHFINQNFWEIIPNQSSQQDASDAGASA